jgi:hypothetical protein
MIHKEYFMKELTEDNIVIWGSALPPELSYLIQSNQTLVSYINLNFADDPSKAKELMARAYKARDASKYGVATPKFIKDQYVNNSVEYFNQKYISMVEKIIPSNELNYKLAAHAIKNLRLGRNGFISSRSEIFKDKHISFSRNDFIAYKKNILKFFKEKPELIAEDDHLRGRFTDKELSLIQPFKNNKTELNL